MASQARDGFQEYFAEKLWAMIPAVYRDEDARAEKPGVLRAIVEVLAEQAAYLRRSNDRLWEDQFIELCNDWAVPYIGDLVATRLVSALNLRGRRVDVAKTIYYRRRKGTLRVLEELISDIAGWEGKVVEEFRRIARARHGLDPAPTPLAGRFTGTPPGGIADLRRPRGASLTGGPFDEYHHMPDVRRFRGGDGRYNIPKLGFHLYRLHSFPLQHVKPRQGPNTKTFTFDPSGRDVPLFARRSRPDDWDEWRSAEEWQLPAPIRCRVLGHAEYVIDEALVQDLVNNAGLSNAAADELRTFRQARFLSEQRLRQAVATLANQAAILSPAVFHRLLAGALVEDCGKRALIPDSVRVETVPGTTVPREVTASGDLSAWTANVVDKEIVIDPERGRLFFVSGPPPASLVVSTYYGFSGVIGAGTYGRRATLQPVVGPPIQGGGAITAAAINANGATEVGDSATYSPVASKTGVQNLVIQAADQQRPYLRLAADWVLDTGVNVDSTLVLDGLWLGADGAFAVVLRGDWRLVTIRNATLDPGGTDALGNSIPPVPLVVEGNIGELVVERSILATVQTQSSGLVEKLTVQDSIVQSTAAGVPAIDLPSGDVKLERVTIFGTVEANRLEASEALITGLTDITDTQAGCFRFGAAPAGSRLPHPYESHVIADSDHFFTSRRFGHPGYAQLSESAPEGLLRGAENGSEIGAFSSLLNPVKLDGLQAKAEEYMPFGLIPIFIFET